MALGTRDRYREFLVLLVTLGITLLCLPQVTLQQEDITAACLYLDGTDRATMLAWVDCENGDSMFTFKDYADLPGVESSDPEVEYLMMNEGSGSFCIESQVGMNIDAESNIQYQVLYKFSPGGTGDPVPNFYFHLVDEFGDDLVRNPFVDSQGFWGDLEDSMEELFEGVIKVRITANLREDDVAMIERIIAVDLTNTNYEECLRSDGLPTTPEVSTSRTTEDDGTDNTATPDLNTEENYTSDTTDGTEDPDSFSPTTEWPEESTTDLTEEPSTDWTEDPDSFSKTTDWTEEPSTDSSPEPTTNWTEEPVTEVITESSPATDEPLPTSDPWIGTSPATEPPPFALPEDELNVWMILAIVFISLFSVSVLLSIYYIFLPRHKAALRAKARDIKITNLSANERAMPVTNGMVTTVPAAAQATKLPRLYVGRVNDKTVITSRHK